MDNQDTTTVEPSPEPSQTPSRKRPMLPISILLGAVIIAASVLYAGHSLSESLQETLNSVKAAQVSVQTPPVTAAQTAPAQPAAPAGPVTITDRANEPVQGSSNAKVTMVEFGDFQCPYCQEFFNQTLPQITANYINTGKVKLIFRHFPLSFHVNAQIAAVAAECANEQGKFWQYHDILYKNAQSDGTNLDKASLEKYANQLGLNSGTLGFGTNKFNSCLESNATLSVVQGDTAEGTKDGVTGTPTFFINGVALVGAQPYSVFQQAIENALKQ